MSTERTRLKSEERSAVPRGKIALHVARWLMRQARERSLEPGDFLAAEHEIIEQLGVARGSVREGLRLLETMGAITLRRGSGGGVTITKPRPELLANSLSMMLQSSGGTLGTILEARNIIEPTMAAYAAMNRTEHHVAELRACVETLRASTKRSARFHEANRRFHDVVAEASGNELLAALMPSLSWMSAAADWELSLRVRDRVAEDKSGIADAIEMGDSRLASERMARMVMAVEEIERRNPGFFSKPILWADVNELLEKITIEAPTKQTPTELSAARLHRIVPSVETLV